jgi:HEAT repeat protein
LFPDPDKLLEYSPAEVLDAAARGHLGLDHRFLHALIDRPEQSLPALLKFAVRNYRNDTVDLSEDVIALFRLWRAPEGIPFLVAYLREDPENIPDEAIEALVDIGQPALEPLLALYEELDESESGEIAFILASLRIRDERILKILLDRLEYDLLDTLLLLEIYGDPAARPAIEQAAAGLTADEAKLMQAVEETKKALEAGPGAQKEESAPFDIWPLYPERADLPVELLDEDERLELLNHPVAGLRASAASSFFNREISPEQRKKLLAVAKEDEAPEVRARAWEALAASIEDTEVVSAMLDRLRNPETPIAERGGLVVGLAFEADRNEVRDAIVELYGNEEGRAKALEAMWRSMHPSFRNYFSKHLDDADLEVRRAAIWGVGYYGIRSDLGRIRKLLEDEELRTDALFAYALALPGETSRGRVKGLFARVEKDAHGLSEIEEELVKAALDERLMLAGKEPVFREQED